MRQDLLNSGELPAVFTPTLQQFFQETAALPLWADQRKMRAAMRFFQQYSRQIMGLLGSYSLPWCYAAADGAKVLYFSERMHANTYQRLQETGKFLFDVLDPKAFATNGYGIRSIQKVRLIHEVIRYHLRKSPEWDMAWGLPVNQEDMAGTNLAFSLVIIRGLRKTGHTISPEETDAWLHLWKVTGYLLGVDERLLPDNGKEASLLLQKIEGRHFKPSKEGKLLMTALLKSFEEFAPLNFPKGYLHSYVRYLVGEKAADLLGLDPSNWTTAIVKQWRNFNLFSSFFSAFSNGEYAGNVKKAREEALNTPGPIELKLPAGVGRTK